MQRRQQNDEWEYGFSQMLTILDACVQYMGIFSFLLCRILKYFWIFFINTIRHAVWRYVVLKHVQIACRRRGQSGLLSLLCSRLIHLYRPFAEIYDTKVHKIVVVTTMSNDDGHKRQIVK